MDAVTAALTNIGSLTSAKVVIALSLAGTLTMAILQSFKDLTPIRRYFQTKWISRWLATRTASFNQALATLTGAVKPPAANSVVAAQELVNLATGGERRAFYDLPADQLVAQMNAAAQIALDYPSTDHYYALLAVLSEGADLADVYLVQSVPTARGAVAAGGALPSGYTDARTRVGHRIQRNLDGLQIAMSDDWQWYLQLAALLLSIVLIEIAIFWQSDYRVETSSVIAGALIGIIGGYLAPVTRDLVAALQNLRKP